MKHTKIQNKHIFICNGKDCKKNGCEGLKAELKKYIKEKNLKRVRIIKTKCMDYCKLGPNIVAEGKLLHDCNPKDIPAILQELSKDS